MKLFYALLTSFITNKMQFASLVDLITDPLHMRVEMNRSVVLPLVFVSSGPWPNKELVD